MEKETSGGLQPDSVPETHQLMSKEETYLCTDGGRTGSEEYVPSNPVSILPLTIKHPRPASFIIGVQFCCWTTVKVIEDDISQLAVISRSAMKHGPENKLVISSHSETLGRLAQAIESGSDILEAVDMRTPHCHKKVEEENSGGSSAENYSQRPQPVCKVETQFSTDESLSGNEESPSSNQEIRRSPKKEQVESSSVGSTHSDTLGKPSQEMDSASDVLETPQMVLVKEEPASPLSVSTQSDDSEDVDEHVIGMKMEENVEEEESDLLEESVNPYSSEGGECVEVIIKEEESDSSQELCRTSFSEGEEHEFSNEIGQQPHIVCSAASGRSQIVSSSYQAFSNEALDSNNQPHSSKDSLSSEHGTLFVDVASCSTADEARGQEEAAERYFLEGHGAEKVAGEPFKCSTCQEVFAEKDEFIRHMLVHLTKKCFNCSHCDKAFKSKGELIAHERTHSGEKPFKCSECEMSFSQKSNLKTHMRTHSGEKPFSCSECGKSFARCSHLTLHMRTHTNERPYECSQCGKTFKETSSLSKHMITHGDERPFKCNQCEKTFKSRVYLNIHLKTHLGEKPFKCSGCGKCFTNSSNLSVHMRTHTGDQPYKCDLCGKFFAESGALIEHQETHTSEESFKCEQCGKCYTDSSYLSDHMRTHTAPKPFDCSVCGKNFSQSRNLIVHMRTHTGDKPFCCSQCGLSFIQKSDLTKHTRTHSGERPYKCSQCGKTFTRSHNLTVHMRSHSGERPYSCSQCGRAFSDQSNLARHMRVHI